MNCGILVIAGRQLKAVGVLGFGRDAFVFKRLIYAYFCGGRVVFDFFLIALLILIKGHNNTNNGMTMYQYFRRK